MPACSGCGHDDAPLSKFCAECGGPLADIGTAKARPLPKIAGVETELTYKRTKLTGGSIVLEGASDSATSVDTITVTSHADGSEITYENTIEAKGIGKLAEPLMKPVFERIGTKTEDQSPLRSVGTSTACSCRLSSGTKRKTAWLVEASTTCAAAPSW